MIEALKRRLENLEHDMKRSGYIFRVRLPNGREIKTTASEWWKNRNDWKWVETIQTDKHGWPPFLLLLAKTFDDSVAKARANGGTIRGVNDEVLTLEYLTEQRNDCLLKFFGEVRE